MVSQSSSVGYTIMGKTADLTVVQKATIDTLHKEGKTQKVIAKEAGCSQSSVSKYINREVKARAYFMLSGRMWHPKVCKHFGYFGFGRKSLFSIYRF